MTRARREDDATARLNAAALEMLDTLRYIKREFDRYRLLDDVNLAHVTAAIDLAEKGRPGSQRPARASVERPRRGRGSQNARRPSAALPAKVAASG
jgi:hypothetical protein